MSITRKSKREWLNPIQLFLAAREGSCEAEALSAAEKCEWGLA
jgi:hypothetical protein